MAKKKKTTEQDERTADAVLEGQIPQSQEEEDIDANTASIEETKPKLRSDQEQLAIYYRLLDEAPRRPEFYRIEDAVQFADIYDKWYRKVLLECPK